MITINEFVLSSDLQSVQVTITPGDGMETLTSLLAWVGDSYMSETPIDLTSLITGSIPDVILISKEELGITTDIINDVVTIQAENSINETTEASIISMYYENIVLAKKIALSEIQSSDGFKEVEILFFLIEATKSYIESGMVEEALNVYSRVKAICTNYPDYMLTDDIPEQLVGSGAWIINGKYVIH